jgi:F420-dependent oxidoreductase-like protein
MKFGMQHPNFTYDGQGSQVVDSLKGLATEAERTGFDSFWVMDHFHQIQYVGQPKEPMLESWTTLSVLAGMTSKIRLGPLVTGNVYRHPSVLAKIGATLDVLSKGRLFMGIGAAWNEEESQAYGIPFPPTKERFRRLEEAAQIIRKMWTEEKVDFDGQFYKIKGAYCNPKPVQKPHPPIMIGGSGEKETLRLVAKYGDACNVFGSPDTFRKKMNILLDHCKTVGRDYDSILKTKLGVVMIDKNRAALEERIATRYKGVPEAMLREMVTYGGPEDVRRQLESFRDAGVQLFIMSFEPDRQLDELKLFGSEVAKHF